jgi:tetratricopeptide (TPR) repeat protein
MLAHIVVILALFTFGVPALTSAQSQAAQTAMSRQRAQPAYRMGLDYMRAEAWPEAAKAFQQAIDIDPEFDLAYYWLGRVNMNTKKYEEAIAAYAKCRDLITAQASRQFTNQIELQRYRQDRLTEIDEMIRQVQGAAQTGQAQERLRQLQEYRRQVTERTQRGNTTMTIDTSVPAFVSLALGSAYFRVMKFADAEREYKAAISADPKTGEAHNNLAVVYLQTDRIDEAEKAIKAAEKTGFKVNPMLKDDIAAAKKK